MKIAILSILTILFFGVIGLSSSYDENQFKLPLNGGILPRAVNKPYYLSETLISEFKGQISAYNTGDESQNDSSPCIGAFNENLCEATDLVFANNYYLPGTLVCVETVGCGRIADRMNKRYGKNNFDIAMKLEDKQIALNFGRKNLTVRVYKK